MPGGATRRCAILRELLAVARESVLLLRHGVPDPECLTQLMARRSRLFEALVQGAPYEITPMERALANELLDLDRLCTELAQLHLNVLSAEIEQARSKQRGLYAYGYTDPGYAPRGAFVDTRQE